MSTLKIDYSTLELFKSCPQKFINQHILNLEPKTPTSSDALDFGNLIHFALEIIGLSSLTNLPEPNAVAGEIEYLSSNQPPLISSVSGKPLPELETKHILIQALHAMAAYAATRNFPLLNYHPDERRSLKHALTLISRYVYHHFPETIRYTSFEQFLEFSLGTLGDTEIIYCGTIDAASTNSTSPALIEHKTSSYLNSAFIERINPSDQVDGYLYLWNETYPENKIYRTIFDGISTSGYGKTFGSTTSQPSRWTINTKPEQLFLRTETNRTQSQIDQWRERTLLSCSRVLETIQHFERTGLSERRAPNACTEFNSKCTFIDLCRGNESDLRNILFQPKAEQWKGFEYVKD